MNSPASDRVIELTDVEFRYPVNDGFGLYIPTLSVASGESAAIVGPSGSGKTTLLGLLAGILQPGTGRVTVNGTDLTGLDESRRRQFRIQNVGQVFQAFELLHYLTVVENVMLPHYIRAAGSNTERIRHKALELLSEMGLSNKADTHPSELSQGEQQRVAVARAMLNHPALLLADEPTGNLDQENKQNVVDLLLEQAKLRNTTLLMVTHDQSLLASFSRVLDISSVTSARAGDTPA